MKSSSVVVRAIAVGLAVGLSGLQASAAIDGVVTPADGYGAARTLQTVQTQFGDNFSEWNGAYASISGGRLNIAFTGNLEANFNKFELFIDSRAGGQATFDSSGNDNAGRMDGLTFDTGFTADYHVIVRRGNNGVNDTFDIDFANLTAQSASGYGNIFSNSNFGSGSTGTGVNAHPIFAAYDGSNSAGIIGGTGAADQSAAALVTTGLELSFDLSDLGYLGGDIRLFAFQNGGGHDFASNQFLPGLTPPQGNLGGDGNGNFTGTFAVNLNTFYPGAAEGWFTVPTPGAAGVLGLGALAAIRRRR
jgi:MYXO-CTERM domain-containing protein